MFTLKHISGLSEAIYQAEEVVYLPGTPDMPPDDHVEYLSGKEWKSLRYGVVYIMNDAGKTVASYEMGRPPLQGQVVTAADLAAHIPGSQLKAA